MLGPGVVEELGNLWPLFASIFNVVEDEEVLPLGHLLLLNIFV